MPEVWLLEGTTATGLTLDLWMTESTLDPCPLAAWFFKPFNSIPAPFLMERWRENFLWTEGQASNWKIILVTGVYTPVLTIGHCVLKSLLNSCPKCFCCYFFAPSFHKVQSGILYPGLVWFDHTGPGWRGKEQRVVSLHTPSSCPVPSSSDQIQLLYFLP